VLPVDTIVPTAPVTTVLLRWTNINGYLLFMSAMCLDYDDVSECCVGPVVECHGAVSSATNRLWDRTQYTRAALTLWIRRRDIGPVFVAIARQIPRHCTKPCQVSCYSSLLYVVLLNWINLQWSYLALIYKKISVWLGTYNEIRISDSDPFGQRPFQVVCPRN